MNFLIKLICDLVKKSQNISKDLLLFGDSYLSESTKERLKESIKLSQEFLDKQGYV